MTHASVFSGIGGPEIAAAMLGWDNLFHCEINPFGRAVLDYWFPKSVSYEDITKTDFSEWRGRVNVLTGGFPCQPFSYAGKRGGAEDDRYLWPYMFRCIDQVRPDWVVCENVAGILTMVEQGEVSEMASQRTLFDEGDGVRRYRLVETFTLQRICDDLEGHGYSVQPVLIPALAVGAPHRRDRVFIVGHRNTSDSDGRADGRNPRENEGESRKERLQERDEIRLADQPSQVRPAGERNADANSAGCGAGTPRKSGSLEGVGSDADIQQKERQLTPQRNNRLYDVLQLTTDSERIGRIERQPDNGLFDETQQSERGKEQPCGANCPHDRWRAFPTQPPVHRGNDGLPFDVDYLSIPFNKWRTESIKAYGNAIVPQVMYEIFRTIESVENGTYDTTNGF